MNNQHIQRYNDKNCIEKNDDNISNMLPIAYPIYDQCQCSSNDRSSLHQLDHHIDMTASSIDDLTQTNQVLASTFHSKDSALGLSNDNLNYLQMNELNIFDDIHKQQQTSLLIAFQDQSKSNLIFKCSMTY